MTSQPGVRATGPDDIDPDRQPDPEHDREGQTWEQMGRGVTAGRHEPYRTGMCRSIKTLRRPGETTTTGELEAAARQYVRKLSGYREPSARNREAFDAAIAEIAHASRHLVEALGVDVEDGPNRWVGRDGVVHTGA